jgi:hypothetical protein
MPQWADFFKLFTWASEKDPLAKTKDIKNLPNAGTSQPDIRPGVGGEPNGSSYRQTYDLIDTTTLNNRPSRYKEYDRLRNMPEIEQVMTVLADEACIAGDTKIATPFGFQTIESLTNTYKPDERFLVYCWNFDEMDYTLGWAYHPRKVKKAPTVQIILDDGSKFVVTPDHRILLENNEWIEAGKLKFGQHLKPFYRIPANYRNAENKTKQFPRIMTFNRGWIHERQFVDEWRTGKRDESLVQVNRIVKMLGSGLTWAKTASLIGVEPNTINSWMTKEGFTRHEAKMLNKLSKYRRVVSVSPGPEIDVYDLSVENHQCFATDSVIMHNCQKDEDGNIFKVQCKNEAVKKETEFLLRHRKMLNLNEEGWSWFKNLCIFGDWFVELVLHPDNPKQGIARAIPLPPENMYRIESTKGKVIEFQQAADGPDYTCLSTGPVTRATETELAQAKAIRFPPSQIVHFRLGDNRKNFYPYGQSLIEPARGPAHSLRLMEDAMVVYRLSRSPERRIFYVDVGQLPPFKAEAFVDRLKDQFRKRKTTNSQGSGANQVEEKFQPPAIDEDIWMPIRPNSQTRIDTLPGAQNLGEIDDALYFRNKLFTALNFPKNYFANEDVNSTRITLSAQDVKFARMIERLQGYFVSGLLEIVERHLEFRGFPEDSYEDLRIQMTPPSDWRELSRAEVVNGRYGNATTLKSGQLMSDYDIHIKILKYNEDETEEMLSRLKIQKLEDLKLQVIAQNPQLLGIGVPNQDSQQGQEMGTEAGGPNLNPSPAGMQPEQPPSEPAAAPEMDQPPEGEPLPDAEPGYIKKFDLEIQDYETEMDQEGQDHSVGDNS